MKHLIYSYIYFRYYMTNCRNFTPRLGKVYLKAYSVMISYHCMLQLDKKYPKITELDKILALEIYYKHEDYQKSLKNNTAPAPIWDLIDFKALDLKVNYWYYNSCDMVQLYPHLKAKLYNLTRSKVPL